MRHIIGRFLLIVALVAAGLAWNGELRPTSTDSLVTTVEARVGRPATPVSYAGVARRSTVRGPANRGGPVNRVGRR
jgi:hypothetical protein